MAKRIKLDAQPSSVSVPGTGYGESPAGVVERVIDARNAARKARDFALADRLRNALAAEGIVLTDGKDGTTWTVAAG